MRIGRDELRLASLEELQFGGWKLHVAFATPTKLRERLCYQPRSKNIGSMDGKHRYTRLFNLNLPFWHSCWALHLSCLEKCALSDTLSSIPLHPPSTLVTQLYLGTAQHPQLHTGRSGHRPLHLRSHIATLLLGFSLSQA